MAIIAAALRVIATNLAVDAAQQRYRGALWRTSDQGYALFFPSSVGGRPGGL
jgi:hypothetical protein